MDEQIIGYGVFEDEDGSVYVGYYTDQDSQDDVDQDNFYKEELLATQVALSIACSRVAELLGRN